MKPNAFDQLSIHPRALAIRAMVKQAMNEVSLRFLGSGDAFGSGGRFQTCIHLAAPSHEFVQNPLLLTPQRVPRLVQSRLELEN